jgi:hypothetical protein
LKAFAIELRKPDAEEQAKKDAEAERKRIARERRIAEIHAEEQAKLDVQANCEHLKENGKTAIVRGQPYNDGFFKPFCLRCNKQFTPVKAEMADMTA